MVAGLSHEALRSHVNVYLYLIDEGVKNLENPAILSLASAGVKLSVCAYGCQQHKVSTEGYGQEVTFCGLVVLSQIITGCDRFHQPVTGCPFSPSPHDSSRVPAEGLSITRSASSAVQEGDIDAPGFIVVPKHTGV